MDNHATETDLICETCGHPLDDHSGMGLPCPHSKSPLSSNEMTHTRSCRGAHWDGECTCGLELRIALETEKTLHAAWQKRAMEAEAELRSTTHETLAPASKEQPDQIRVRDLSVDTEHDIVNCEAHGDCSVQRARDRRALLRLMDYRRERHEDCLTEIERLREQVKDLQQFHDWAEPQITDLRRRFPGERVDEYWEKKYEKLSGFYTRHGLLKLLEKHWPEFLPKSTAPETTVEPIRFGVGLLVVDTGKFQGVPAVFVAPVKEAGKVGASAAHLDHPLDTLQPGEFVLTFPTEQQAQSVADALCIAAKTEVRTCPHYGLPIHNEPGCPDCASEKTDDVQYRGTVTDDTGTYDLKDWPPGKASGDRDA